MIEDAYLARFLSAELSKIDLLIAEIGDALGPMFEIANAGDGSSTKLEAIIRLNG